MNPIRFLLPLLFCISCGVSKKTTTPTLPEPSLPPLPVSDINIPVRIYMRPLLTVMDSMTEKEFVSERWPGYYQPSCDFRYKYRFVRSPFTFRCYNNNVDISFRGNYQIAGSKTVCAFGSQVTPWVSGSCGFGDEPLRRVDLNISSQLLLMPDHRIRTITTLDKIRPLDRCQVSLLQTDMTSEIMDSIKASVESYCQGFDLFVQTLNNNEILQQWRHEGSRVMPVSSYGYLNLNPTAFKMGKFNYASDTLYFSLGFSGRPAFSNDSLKLVTKAPLPPVINTETNGAINTYLNLDYDYSFFTKILNDSLHNKPFEVEGRTFVIKNVTISGSDNGKVTIDVGFTGNREGVLHLSGTPVIDTAKQLLSMPDISFSLDTRDMLAKIAKGLIRKRAMKTLQNVSFLDIGALIKRNREKIAERLNQPINDWMSTVGRLDELKITGLITTRSHLQMQVHIRGSLSLLASPPATLFSMQ